MKKTGKKMRALGGSKVTPRPRATASKARAGAWLTPTRRLELIREANGCVDSICRCAHYDSEHYHFKAKEPCAVANCGCEAFTAVKFRVEVVG